MRPHLLNPSFHTIIVNLHFQMTQRQGDPFRMGRRRNSFTPFAMLLFGKNPGFLCTNRYNVTICLIQHGRHLNENTSPLPTVGISREPLFQFSPTPPGIELIASSGMDCNLMYSYVLQSLCNLHTIDGSFIPAKTNLMVTVWKPPDYSIVISKKGSQ